MFIAILIILKKSLNKYKLFSLKIYHILMKFINLGLNLLKY